MCACRALTQLAWSVARLRHRPGSRWLDAYAQEVALRLALLEPQQLADVCWALAVVGYRPAPELLDHLDSTLAAWCVRRGPRAGGCRSR